MAHELIRLRESLKNTPHFIEPQSFEAILDYLEARNDDPTGVMADSSRDFEASREGRYSYNPDTQVAIMNIEGPLTYRPVTMFGMKCGGTDYQTLKDDFLYLAESGVKTVALYVDSGGGQAYQMIPTARYIRKIADEYSIKLIGYVDGRACSAAYGLISACDEIIVAEGAYVGSIGVLVELMNDSKHLEMKGLKRTFIYAGDEKVPFDENGDWTESFIEEIQETVDECYVGFTTLVSEFRGMALQSVIDTQARVFLDNKSIELGLADKVMNVEDFYEYLAEEADRNFKGDNSLFGRHKLFSKQAGDALATQQEVENNMTLDELKAQLTAAQAELSEKSASLADLTAKHESYVAETTEVISTLKTSLESAQEAVAILESEKAQAKTDARKAELAKYLPVEKAEELTVTLSALDDAAFAATVASYALLGKQKDNADLFEELGGQGASASDAVTTEDNDLLKQIRQATLSNA